jgi:hypothetical protein
MEILFFLISLFLIGFLMYGLIIGILMYIDYLLNSKNKNK